ncbi:hypothetical protein [Luteolibacter sp. Populi]|uniref:nucleotidyltransferase domain-containing protein n=1 Tax=Luteolibacter sp. Populi TaxID=3230487 RepID=UPI0034653E09
MLPQYAQSLYERFESEGIPLLLAGGWAVSHHGHSRYTRDVDWICSRADEVRALALMKLLGFEIAFEAMATRFQLAKDQDFPPIDLLWVSAETFEKMADTDQRTGFHGDIPVINFEALLSMKLHALKDREERHDKDLLDIRELLGKNRGAVTESRLRELCERFAGPSSYDLVRMKS